MITIKKLRNHQVLDFAYEELASIASSQNDLQHQSTDNPAIQYVIGTWEDCEQQLTLDRTGNIWPWQSRKEQPYDKDSYSIIRSKDQVILTGQSERSTLYAVYEYCKVTWQLEWIYPDLPAADLVATENQPETTETPHVYEPAFKRRGFVYENLKDVKYLVEVVDWLAKNRLNELFLTFPLWHYLRETLTPELSKRGIDLTLGGHSMKFFTEKQHEIGLNSDGTAPAFAGKKQLDYEEESWQHTVIDDIMTYCRDIPMLTTLSMWPEDTAISNETTLDNPFIAQYIRFSEQLQRALDNNGIPIQVEHIAYNAGLSWDMLEVQQGMETSKSINTLFAYWGRDYSQGWHDYERIEEGRAYQALKSWVEETRKQNRELAIFEYYSDHFMLSHLFPSLPDRIVEDLACYQSLGITAITNLVVPYPQADESYSWKWAQGYNSYVFARAAWGDSYEAIMDGYWNQYADRNERGIIRKAMEMTSGLLQRITAYNVPLFPARVVDVKKATTDDPTAIVAILKEIISFLDDAFPSIHSLPYTELSPAERYFTHLYKVAYHLEEEWALK